MSEAVKRLIKWMLPTPIRVFEWGTERTLAAVGRLQKQLDGLAGGMQKQIDGLSAGMQEEHRRANELLAQLQEGKRRTNDLLAQLQEEHNRSKALLGQMAQEKKFSEQDAARLQELEKQSEQIRRKLSVLAETIGSHVVPKMLYNNDYERRVVQSFHEMRGRADYREKYLALVRGLDPESAGLVARILNRQQLIQGTEGRELDLYTPEEQAGLRELEADFQANIFRVAEDLYSYRGYLLPIRSFSPSVFCERHGLARVENLAALRDKDLVDVGGFIGDSALILAPLTDRKVYSFEGVAGNHQLLLKTLELNGVANVVAENLALGARRGTLTLNVSSGCSSVHVPATPVSHQEPVAMVALDDYVGERGLAVGLIKVDIEGFEQEFLKGAEQTIKKHKPVLLLSIYHNADDFFDIKPRIESWKLGYRFKVHKPVDHTVSREVLLIAEVR